MELTRNDLKRFVSKIRKLPGDDACWEWIGGRRKKKYDGYGVFSKNNYPHRAHRIAWMLKHGQIPNGLWVLHKCDNPCCVRPSHLFLGTHQDNMDDMARKGRSKGAVNGVKGGHYGKFGAAHPRSILTDDDIRKIRKLLRRGFTKKRIAAYFGVCSATISNIYSGLSWSHVK